MRKGQVFMIKKIGVLIIAATLALSLTACGDSVSIVENADTVTETTAMFERHTLDDSYSILVDKETGVCYLEYKCGVGYKGYYGITVMLNADGTPKIWEEDQLDRKCENCLYYEHEDIDDGYVCVNDDSDYCTDWVEPDFSCIDWVKGSE